MTVDYNKVEVIEARRDGATLVRNSGRGMFKGDATMGPFLVDYKYGSKGFTINVSKWAKINSDAFQNGMRIPTLKLILENLPDPVRLFIIDENSMMEYKELKEKYPNG